MLSCRGKKKAIYVREVTYTALVRPEELESPAFGSVDQRSIQLSYGRMHALPLSDSVDII